MALNFDLNEQVVGGQIELIRHIMRFPSFTPKERYCLAELLRMLYILKNELAKPEEEMNRASTMTLPQLLEIDQFR